jgi:phosphatidylglycerophosphatase A
VSGERPVAEQVAVLVATLGGAGRSPYVPGTVGTLAAMPLAVLLWLALPLWGFVLATCAVAAAGVWAGGVTARRVGLKDPGIVVIDEAAGIMVTLIGVPFGWPAAAGAFVLFRVMDVVKPPPAAQAERLPGGFGIMTDDLVAGVYANLALRLSLFIGQAAAGVLLPRG